MPNDLREMIQKALAESLKEGLDALTEFAKENPDVFRRGAMEYLKPSLAPKNTAKVRKELAEMDPDEAVAAFEQIIGATSVEEAVAILEGGRKHGV